MIKDGFLCEFCLQEIVPDDFLFLSENIVYDMENARIVHTTCNTPRGVEILQTVETRGELRLVLVNEEE